MTNSPNHNSSSSKPDEAMVLASENPALIISSDPKINELLNDVVGRLREYIETLTRNLTELSHIGVALSSTRNLDQLLEMIVDKARDFTDCDGGTLYLVSDNETELKFTIAQTESLGRRMGGLTGGPITLKPVALTIDGEPNNSHVCAYVANSGKLVNIPDVYEHEGFNFEGTRAYDKISNYRCRSMLVIPMRDHQGDIIGVLQLINAYDVHTGEIIPFRAELQTLTEALASQAAVAITNARLIRDQQNLFESFIKTIATAIDEKSTYTGGHIERVANLTMDIAQRINQATEGYYANFHFTEDELAELRLAAWLHDTGKITTPEYVVDKRTKLETIFDREELVRVRFELAMVNHQLRKAAYKAKLFASDSSPEECHRLIGELEAELNQCREDYAFITGTNYSSEFMPDSQIERLKTIALKEVQTSVGPEPLLNENELYNLTIRKGTLTPEEYKVIQNHVSMTLKLLERMPFPKKLRNVPFYAGAHHEKLNGKGYPRGLKGDQIPLQARILTLADIFEALTAKDRPYKQPKKLSEVLKIIGFMVKDSELDGNLVQLFLDQKMHLEYGQKHLESFQMDL